MDLSSLFSMGNPYLDPGMSAGGMPPGMGQSQMPPGLMGKMQSATAPYGGLMNLGLQLMANSGPSPVKQPFGAILGKSMLQSKEVAIQDAGTQMQLAQMRMALGKQGLLQAIMQQRFGGPPGAQQAPPAGTPPVPTDPTAAAPGGLMSPQQAAAGGQPAVPSAAPQPAAAPDLSSTQIAGMDPDTYRLLGFAQNKDPLQTEKEIHEEQLRVAQQRAAPQLDLLDTVIKSDKPAQYVKARPALLQQWQAVAPTLGIDPAQGLNDQNVRVAFGFARNQVAGSAQMPFEAPVLSAQTTNGSLGSIYQKDPLTGKITQVKGEESLKDVVGPNGLPVAVRASAAEGKQPFNQSIFGAASMSDQAIQFAADTYRTTGKMPAAFGRNPAMQAKVLDKVAADAAAAGDSAGAIAARSGSLKANGMALDQNTKLLTATRGYAETLEKNLDNLKQAYSKVDSTGSPLINRAFRIWQQGGTGDKDTASMVTWLNAVQGEYAKLKSGSLGNQGATDASMRDAKEVINKYMNAGGIQAVSDAMRGEKENRIGSIMDENSRLTSAMGQGAPGKPSAADNVPHTNAKGWVLHIDKNGNKAYVSPDGKQFEAAQ